MVLTYNKYVSQECLTERAYLCKAESSTNHVGASYGLMEKVACIAIAMGLKATFQTENPKS